MTDVSIAVDRPATARATPRDGATSAARLVVITGAALIATALVFLVLVEHADVPSDGHPGAGRVLVRLGSSAALLVIGGLLVGRVSRQPSNLIVCFAIV
jgi:hypothetical protein